MKKILTFIFLVLALCLQSAPAFAGELENTLKSQYEKHVLGLRSPLQGTHLKFDSTGKPLEQPTQERWTVYGGIYIQKISLRPEKLELEGPWVGFGLDKESGRAAAISLGKQIRVEIQLDDSVKSVDDIRALVDRVFFADDKDHKHTLPEFRRDDFVATGEPTGKLVVKKVSPLLNPYILRTLNFPEKHGKINTRELCCWKLLSTRPELYRD